MQITHLSNLSPPIDSTPQKINKNHFSFLYVIGRGGFGRVWKVLHKKSKVVYALKEMSKLKIIDKKSEKSINSERELLTKLRHPFIVNMHYAFQDNDNLYLVMDMLGGGDLRYHVSRYRRFSEDQTRFFIACLVWSLNYIHAKNVIHRDIKPENLVMDARGYVSITDFGIAKINTPDNSSETSGTPGYMAPEVIMRGKNHTFSVDFFAIGVIGYEFMIGKRPYQGRSRKEIKEQMLSKQARITPDKVMSGWSKESVDFINSLLLRKPEMRMGSTNGAKELMNHPWLKNYPWKQLESKILQAPFVPEKRDNFDKRYCEIVEKITENTKARYDQLILGTKIKTAFVSFYYCQPTELISPLPTTKKIIVKSRPLSLSRPSSIKNIRHGRSSSVISTKNTVGVYEENPVHENDLKIAYDTSNKLSKLNSARMKMKMMKKNNNNSINRRESEVIKINIPYKRLNRVNSASQIVCKPTTEYLFNKIKSISIVNNGSRLNLFKGY